MKVGNTWKYQYFKRIDQTDDFESIDAFDDATISNTSVINYNEYYTFETTTSGNESYFWVPDNGTIVTKLRDSLGYLVNENGVKQFSYSNPNQEYLISDGSIKIYGVLSEDEVTGEMATGRFLSSLNEVFTRFPDGNKSPGTDYYYYYYYSKEIGQIKTTYSWVSDSLHRLEKRLISYNIVE